MRMLVGCDGMKTAHPRASVAEAEATAVCRMVVIDDDDLSREVLELIAAEAGFEARSFESGEAALEELAGNSAKPAVILSDIQMPGISGSALAKKLRAASGDGTLLLAMSGSAVAEEKLVGFDGFLLKPFSVEELAAAYERKIGAGKTAVEPVTSAIVLNETVYANFARGMPAPQVAGLYKMCIDDAHKRLRTMRRALAERDDAGYRRAAHAIKGGCGMVGAVELAGLAAEMEANGLEDVHDETPIARFLAASERLERMLEDKVSGLRSNVAEITYDQ
jgi:CheY-like chemotaxis protein/HPt (histidine-containing phosphotransfer) domain-containing protein